VSMKGREGMRPDEGSLSRHVVKLVGASAHPGVITPTRFLQPIGPFFDFFAIWCFVGELTFERCKIL
jgi:hypothetical protein